MENTFVVNNEPITIKITIEVIPAKKKETPVEPPITVPSKEPVTKPEGWDVIEPEDPPVEPVATPEKKKRAYTKKTKDVVPTEPLKDEEPLTIKPPVVPEAPRADAPNKVVARLAQMIRFFCKASNISTAGITKKYLIEHGAADIFENVVGITDEMIEEAIKEASMK